MFNCNVVCYLLLRRPAKLDENKIHENFWAMLNELPGFSKKLEFTLGEFGTVFPKIELEKKKNNFIRGISSEILKISFQVHITNDFWNKEMEYWGDDISEENLKELIREELWEHSARRTLDLIIAANLAKAGSLSLTDSKIFVNRKQIYKLGRVLSDTLQLAYESTWSSGWPRIIDLDFELVWKWLISNKGYIDRFSENRVERALNAFSHLFYFASNEGEEMKLFWALTGIEAIYLNGKTGIMDSVRERIHAFLGEPHNFKKDFSKLYDFRSRFVHGDLDFPGAQFTFDALPEYERFRKDLGKSTDLAVAILLSTIQELIKRDWKGLKFSYEINGSN